MHARASRRSGGSASGRLRSADSGATPSACHLVGGSPNLPSTSVLFVRHRQAALGGAGDQDKYIVAGEDVAGLILTNTLERLDDFLHGGSTDCAVANDGSYRPTEPGMFRADGNLPSAEPGKP